MNRLPESSVVSNDKSFTFFAKRDLPCPENLPRKLFLISPASATVASQNEAGKITNPVETSIHLADNIIFDILLGNDTSFQCHDCPLPETKGCITNVRKLYREHSQEPINKEERTRRIFNELTLSPTTIEASIPAKIPPSIEPTQQIPVEIQEDGKTLPIPDNRPIEIKLAEWKRQIEAYYREHPEEINDTIDPDKLKSIHIAL